MRHGLKAGEAEKWRERFVFATGELSARTAEGRCAPREPSRLRPTMPRRRSNDGDVAEHFARQTARPAALD
jgi:hypothetical protein